MMTQILEISAKDFKTAMLKKVRANSLEINVKIQNVSRK